MSILSGGRRETLQSFILIGSNEYWIAVLAPNATRLCYKRIKSTQIQSGIHYNNIVSYIFNSIVVVARHLFAAFQKFEFVDYESVGIIP